MLNQTLANRYHIIAPIGSGAMGTVYRVADSQAGEEVAVKVALMKKKRPASLVSRRKPDRPPQSATLRGASKAFRLFVCRCITLQPGRVSTRPAAETPDVRRQRVNRGGPRRQIRRATH